MTLDRYTMERGIDFIPAIDVDSSVTSLTDLEKLRTKIRQIYQCFDRPKFMHLGELYESFDRKRAIVRYQSQSEVIKVILLKKSLNFENSNS